jgi:small subunit ribosomal protein S17|tara:strand:- start:76 stop:381 length:306 start_codon:yes stop_codon:yes gene_type:complete
MVNEEKCTDKNCPKHGTVSKRGFKLEGIIVSDKMKKSAVVEISRVRKVQKFKRYEKRRTKIHAHNSACIDARKGDSVVIQECKPISKTKSFVVIEKRSTEQ